MDFTVFGGGSWGTALAIHLRRNNHTVKIWEFNREQAEQMQKSRFCPLLPEKVLIPKDIFITSSLEKAVENTDVILVAVPSDKVETTITNAKKFISNQEVLLCSKGFASRQRLQSDVLQQNLPHNAIYCLYGPTLAIELANGLLTGIVLAGKSDKSALKKALKSDILRVETTDDMIGVQVGAALKNVIAILIGIAEGVGLGQNATAYVFTKGLNEIKTIGVAMGADPETFMGLTAIGDLTLRSRNRMLGVEIGKGRSLEETLKHTNHVLEGIASVQDALMLKNKLNLNLPMISELYKILFKSKAPKEALSNI